MNCNKELGWRQAMQPMYTHDIVGNAVSRTCDKYFCSRRSRIPSRAIHVNEAAVGGKAILNIITPIFREY